jgi:hypothetical protein
MEKRVKISDITIGERHRSDYGDIHALAVSIDHQGLLQAIAVTKDLRLICGERRLRAMRDILNEEHIDARIVDVESILEAEDAENEFRKSLTLSEKANLAQAIREEAEAKGTIRDRERQGAGRPKKIAGQPARQLTDTQIVAGVTAKKGQESRDAIAVAAGFSGNRQLQRAQTVVQKGTPELVKAMDAGNVSVTTAARVAQLPKSQQKKCISKSNGKIKVTLPATTSESAAVKMRKQVVKIAQVIWGIERDNESVEDLLQAWVDEGISELEICEMIEQFVQTEELLQEFTKACLQFAKKKRWTINR